tara:strand:+ start:64 stop:300 length:237 start_codon:yes stop_codon:yes gene_type:complete
MSFKFKLGDIIVPILAREMGIPVGPSEVTALQLGGYIQIQPIGAPHRHLVEAKDYERFEEETVKSDSADNDKAPRRRT